MSKNLALIEKINDPAFWADKDVNEKNALLDSILQLDYENHEEFKEAIRENIEFWDILPANEVQEWITAHTRSGGRLFGLGAHTATEDEYFASNDFLDAGDTQGNSFLEIQQAAAMQRIKSHLDQEADQDILINIMKHNSDDLRGYLEDKVSVLAETPAWKSQSSILNSNLQSQIKTEVATRWISKAVEDTNLSVLEKLHEAATDNDDEAFKEAVHELTGFPEGADYLAFIDMDLVWAIVKNKVIAREEKLAGEKAFSQYQEYITELPDEEVLEYEDLLTRENIAFRTGLDDSVSDYQKHLTVEQVTALREQLGKRYLELAIKKYVAEGNDVGAAFSAKTLEEFKTELKTIFDGHAYIDQVVTPELMAQYKNIMAPQQLASMAQHIHAVIKGDTEVKLLNAIDLAGKDQDFKEALKKVPDFPAELLSHLNQEHIKEIRQAARTRMFEIYVEHFLSLPQGRNPALLDAFSSMKEEAQRKLLNNPLDIRHIVNAHDVSVLHHYMPDAPPAKLQQAVNETVTLDLFKQIQNPEVGSILANKIIPPITLTAAQLTAINQQFVAQAWDDNAYVTLVNNIKNICGVNAANQAHFNQAFQLNAQGTALGGADRSQVDSILQHNKNYQNLYTEYQKPVSTINKKLLGAMLCVPNAVGQIPNTPQDFKTIIQDQMLQYSDYRLFIDVCVKLFQVKAGNNGQFQKALEAGITPALFKEIQQDLVRQALAERTPNEAKKAIKHVEKALEQVQESHVKIAKHLDNAEFVFNVKEAHLNNPLFRSKEKGLDEQESVKTRYKELAKSCDVMMDQLRHDYAQVQKYLEKLPNPNALGNPETQKQMGDKVQVLMDKLGAKKQEIEQQLARYAEIKNKIEGPEGIINMIEKVNSKPYFYYQRAGITSTPMLRSEVTGQAIQNQQTLDNGNTKLDQDSTPEIARFALGGRLSKDQVHCFDVVHERAVADKPDKKITVEGRFTYDISKGASAIAQGNHVSKAADPGRIEILKFPAYKEGSEQDSRDLEKAKVDFAMIVATQLLATMDRPPTKDNPIRLRGVKEEELKYIWTALVILGEKTPNMKFGSDAIRVVNTHIFDPKQEMGWRGFKDGSTYTKVFKNHMDSVNDALQASKEQASEKFNKKAINKPEEGLKVTSNFYRKSLMETKAEERIKSQGVAPQTEEEKTRTLGNT